MKLKLYSVLTVLSLSAVTFAQKSNFDASNARDGETVEYCLTHKKYAELMSNPAAVASFQADEIIRQKEANSGVAKGTVYKIPIVFHVLHNGGSENISDEQIFDAVSILNRDYRLQNADAANVHQDFQGMPTDVEIEFVLATKAPDGTCFTGITRTQSSQTNNGSNASAQLNAIINGNDVYNGQWPGDEYLNVFVCADIGGAAGYTYTPSNWIGSGMDNGIYILDTYLGSIGTSTVSTSRTLTHETGHWLNLQHVWGPNNNPGNTASCNDDDYVSDTPNCIGVTSCNLNEMTCGPRENVENYMDYSYCSKMFTQGQVTRMRNAINSSVGGRSNIITAQNLINTGADGNLYLCQADFTADKTSVCAGDQVQFTDESYNLVSGWSWSFPGGTPSTSTSQNPVITYSTPGLYEVTLNATDGSNPDTEVKTGYIRVLPASINYPVLEGFESYSTLDGIEEWQVVNPGGNQKWEITSTGLGSTQSARLMNYNQPLGGLDELVSAPVDLSSISGSMTLSFRYAYKRKNSSDDDYLRVYVTNDCGDSWAIRKTLHGFQLSSDISAATYTPASDADWVTVHMTNVTSAYWVNNFRYKFSFEAGGGNNMYIDNINIYSGSPSDELIAGVSENEGVSGLSVYPNPTVGELNVRFDLNNAQNTNVEVQDLAGKTIQSHQVHANAGANIVSVSTAQLASGMYFLKVTTAGTQETVQFVVK